ncbi:MAG: hypothetical protein A2201_09835 [Alicyclobacillus sp. RIFOXYA1_FULL_53_8]|nr:MAG: hypothetical protein A2201_09835 [Alicyclobacillus sp. RIFOXYA1_FULL_53_8]
MRTVDANHKRSQLHREETAGRLKSASGRSAASRGRDRLHLSLRQAVQTIGTADSLETVLDQLMPTIQTVFHCDVSLVYIIDESEQQLVPHVSERFNQDDGIAAPSAGRPMKVNPLANAHSSTRCTVQGSRRGSPSR